MKPLRWILTTVFVLVIFFFLLRSLIRNWQQIPFADLRFHPLLLLVSFGFLALMFLCFVRGWQKIIERLGEKIPFRRAFWVMAASQTAKYVPGGIWFALGRVYLGKNEGLKSEIVGLSVIIETALTFLAGIVLFLVALACSRPEQFIRYAALIPAFILFLVLLYPPVLSALLNPALKLFRRAPVTITLHYRDLASLVIYYVGLWLTQIAGFYLLINSIYRLGLPHFFFIMSSYIISWMAGFIVILAPGGLGIREATMTLILSAFLPGPLAIAVSFLSRLWLTLFEIALLVLGLWLWRKKI